MAVQLNQYSNVAQFDLIDYFHKDGLSENALDKIKQDILSGDMTADLLCECNYDKIVENALDKIKII